MDINILRVFSAKLSSLETLTGLYKHIIRCVYKAPLGSKDPSELALMGSYFLFRRCGFVRAILTVKFFNAVEYIRGSHDPVTRERS